MASNQHNVGQAKRLVDRCLTSRAIVTVAGALAYGGLCAALTGHNYPVAALGAAGLAALWLALRYWPTAS
jgi:hypothetical protein